MIIVEPYVKFLIEHNLTQQQYLMLQLIYENRKDLIDRYKARFPEDNGKMISDYLIHDLIQRKYLIKIEKEGLKPTYILGKKFLKVFADKHLVTDEVYKLYPSFFKNEGVTIPLTAMDRNLFSEIYIKKINGSYEEHKEIIKDIEFGIQNDMLKVGINKFLSSEYWKAIRPLRKAEVANVTSNNSFEDF